MQSTVSFFLVAFSAVFFVVDVIGVVPIFLAMTTGDSREKTRRMALRACMVGAGLLAFFALFGTFIFKFLGVSIAAFRVAGGILLLLNALDMLRARSSPTRTSPEEEEEGVHKDDIAVVPLAMPLLAGPGSIATVMVLTSKGNNAWITTPVVLLSIVLTFGISYFVLSGAHVVQKVLKQSGTAILQRLMGLILAAIAVQVIAEGSRDLFKIGG